MRRRPRKIQNKQINSPNVKPKQVWQRLGIAALMAATVGITGCQTFRLPGNPFANGRLGATKLPVPRLPSFGRLPKPNFGNITRSINTPSQQVTTSSSSIASAKKQPPPPPSRVFDSSATDEKIASATGTAGSATKNAPKPAFDFSPATQENTELTAAQKRFREALTDKTQTTNLASASSTGPKPTSNSNPWESYLPNRASSSLNTSVTSASLGKVNHRLYDQYGKLTTNKSTKLSEPMDAKMFAAKISNAEIEKTNQSVADLRKQLEKIKTRGSGSSDDFTLPARSAVELAGSAPIKIEEKEVIPSFKGFGNDDQLSPSRELASSRPVTIPDPTAPKNVLRASTLQTPGLVKTVDIAGPGQYRSTPENGFQGYAATTAPKDLPTGNLLPAGDDDRVTNEFVQAMNQQEIPTLTATQKPKSFEMPLPREVSDASLLAIEENKRAAAAMAQPKITYQNPVSGTAVSMPQKPVAQPVSFVAAPVMTPTASVPVSAFQAPATETVRVTRNQFFNQPIQSATALQVPAAQKQLGQRVAQVTQMVETSDREMVSILPKVSGTSTELPESLTSSSGNYAPGSVVRPQSESLWR